MKYPYALLADIHAHNWSTFSTTNPDGVNSRLQIIRNEMLRAAKELVAAGGDTMVFAGDLFHERGKIDPEVFNPIHDTIVQILGMGITIYAIPGNHDLKGKDTTKLGNAFQTLHKLSSFCVVTEPTSIAGTNLMMVPWQATTKDLKNILDSAGRKPTYDLILHAGIDGVLPGMPDHGLSAGYLAGLGYRRVFAGHYHHHKVMEDGKVVSIGALTQQTWRDVGSKAGFLLVHQNLVQWRASHAPEFVEITAETKEDDIPLLVEGNYVRVRGRKITNAEVAALRASLLAMNAAGTTIEVQPEEVAPRTGAVKTSTVTLEGSVASFIDTMGLPDAAPVKSIANDILTGIRSEAA